MNINVYTAQVDGGEFTFARVEVQMTLGGETRVVSGQGQSRRRPKAIAYALEELAENIKRSEE